MTIRFKTTTIHCDEPGCKEAQGYENGLPPGWSTTKSISRLRRVHRCTHHTEGRKK